MKEVRILTLWQPWASLIAAKLKQYETRSWKSDYRGLLVIHAAKLKPHPYDLRSIELAASFEELEKVQSCLFPASSLPLGCIVAIAELSDCKKIWEPIRSVEAKDPFFIWTDDQTNLELAVGDWQTGRYAWKLENVVALPKPIPYKGGQGLRRVDDETVLRQIQEVIEL